MSTEWSRPREFISPERTDGMNDGMNDGHQFDQTSVLKADNINDIVKNTMFLNDRRVSLETGRANLEASKVNRAGDTMTGVLTSRTGEGQWHDTVNNGPNSIAGNTIGDVRAALRKRTTIRADGYSQWAPIISSTISRTETGTQDENNSFGTWSQGVLSNGLENSYYALVYYRPGRRVNDTDARFAFRRDGRLEITSADSSRPTSVSANNFNATGRVTANSFNATSDIRLKEDIEDVKDEDIANFVNNIKIKTFKFKKDKKDKKNQANDKQIGVIAQEIAEFDIDGVKFADCKNSDYYTVSETKLIYPLIAYCQQLEKRIKALEGK